MQAPNKRTGQILQRQSQPDRKKCQQHGKRGINSRGVAQAKAVIFFLLVAVLALAQQAATSRKEIQQ